VGECIFPNDFENRPMFCKYYKETEICFSKSSISNLFLTISTSSGTQDASLSICFSFVPLEMATFCAQIHLLYGAEAMEQKADVHIYIYISTHLGA
jgi:hypothetical protein